MENELNMKQRNACIDFLKFIFALIIVCHHTNLFFYTDSYSLCPSGYIGVEFFFIVSGYLLANKAVEEKNTNICDANIEMIKQKIIHLFPYVFIACISSNIIYIISNNFVITEIYDHLLYTIVDLLGLQMLGFNGFFATGVSWYISALLLISFILYPFLCKGRLVFTKYIAPLITLLILGYICHTSGSLNNPGEWLGFTFKGVVRGLADISAGCISYDLKKYFDSKENCNRSYLACIEVLGISIVILYAIFHTRIDSHDFFIIPLLTISISIIFSNKSILTKLFNAKIYNRLGAFSLSLYLNNFYVRENITKIVPNANIYELLYVYFLIVLLLSIINFEIGNFLAARVKNIKKVLLCVLTWCAIAELIFVSYQIYSTVSVKSFGGNGSQESPYIIDSAADLRKLCTLVNNGENFSNKYFLQILDIDMNNKECAPIGIFNSGNYFDGVYDGNNLVISNIKISNYRKYNDNVGLFGMLSGTVVNLGIESGDIEGVCAGAIASHCTGDHAQIINCYNKANIVGKERAGGICDNFSGGTLVNCANFGSIESKKGAFPICAYNASKIIVTYPNGEIFPDTFDGEYIDAELTGNSVAEILNKGIDSLNADIVDTTLIKYWR